MALKIGSEDDVATVVANHQERQRELPGERFRERRLAVSRWAGEKDSMPGLESMGAQQIGPVLFLDKLRTCSGDGFRKNEIAEDSFRPALVVAADGRVRGRSGPAGLGHEVLGKPVGNHVMLALALLRDHRFQRATKSDLIAERPGSDEVEEEIRARHGRGY